MKGSRSEIRSKVSLGKVRGWRNNVAAGHTAGQSKDTTLGDHTIGFLGEEMPGNCGARPQKDEKRNASPLSCREDWHGSARHRGRQGKGARAKRAAERSFDSRLWARRRQTRKPQYRPSCSLRGGRRALNTVCVCLGPRAVSASRRHQPQRRYDVCTHRNRGSARLRVERSQKLHRHRIQEEKDDGGEVEGRTRIVSAL